MQIATFPLGPLSTNCYVVYNDSEAVAVDPGGDPEQVIRFLREMKLSLSHILLTHLHFDHTYGVAPLVLATGAAVLASPEDGWMLENEFGQGGTWGLPEVDPYDFSPIGPSELTILGTPCIVLATPGHTPGGLSFYFPALKAVFSGDALFYRSIGRTDFPKGNTDILLQSIREQLFSLPDDTMVFSGHGQESTIGDERKNNPYASDFSTMRP